MNALTEQQKREPQFQKDSQVLWPVRDLGKPVSHTWHTMVDCGYLSAVSDENRGNKATLLDFVLSLGSL